MTSGSIGRYQLIEDIGRGGMATVYRAHDPLFKRDVAIKLMTQDLLEDPNLRARFEREAQTIAALEHPAIVPVYDFGEAAGRPYLVMRLMTGKTLSERLEQGRLSIENTSTILTRIGSALDRAHSKGIIHRDLKPSNIMFDDYGDAFLADFGIAHLTESAVTLTGDSVIGTPAYMSPEQIHSDKAIDGRSDIYALGVICFEMLTGERPYVDQTPTKVMMKHILDPVPNILDVNPELPQEIDSVIAHTMAKDPDERYKSSQELTDTLQRLARAGYVVTPAAAAAISSEPEVPLKESKDDRTEIKAPAAETQIEDVESTEAESSEQRELAGEDEFPATEIAVPSFVEQGPPAKQEAEPADLEGAQEAIARVDEEFPETEVAVPSFIGMEAAADQAAASAGESSLETENAPADDEFPATEVAVPPFVGAPETPTPAPAEGQGGSKRNWLLFGGIGVLTLIFIAAVLSGGIFLFTRSSGDDQDDETDSTSSSQVVAQATNAPVSTNTAVAEQPVPDDELVAPGDEFLDTYYDRFEDGDFEGAREAIEEALVLEPDNLSYIHERARVLFVLGDYDGALEGLNHVIDQNPDEPTYYQDRSAIFREMGDLYGALENLQLAADRGSADEFAFDELADSFMETEDYGAAIAAYDQAIKINPDNEDYYGSRAWAFELIGDYGAAIEDLETAISLNQDALWSYEQLSSLYRWSIEDLDSAREVWSRVISSNPENVWAYNNRGEILRELGNLEGAIEDIQRAIEIEPNNYWFHLQLAKTFEYQGALDRSLEEYNIAVELNPDDPEIYYERAGLYRWEFDDFDMALADYTRAIELDPEASWYYAERASLHRDYGDIDSALADLEMGISIDPHDSWLYLEKATTFVDIGEIDAALEEFARAIDAEPGNPSVYQLRANLLANELGDYDAAFADYERCLEIDPMMPWCFLDWGWALAEIGDADGAIRMFEQFVEYVHPFDCPKCVDEVQTYIDDNS